jgi:hypothetical protein
LRAQCGNRILSTATRLGKEARAAKVSPVLERGCVSVPQAAPWLNELRRELSAFPAGRHDDQVDSMMLFIENADILIARANQAGRTRQVGPRLAPRDLPAVTVRGIGPGRRRPFSELESAVRQHLRRGW